MSSRCRCPRPLPWYLGAAHTQARLRSSGASIRSDPRGINHDEVCGAAGRGRSSTIPALAPAPVNGVGDGRSTTTCTQVTIVPAQRAQFTAHIPSPQYPSDIPATVTIDVPATGVTVSVPSDGHRQRADDGHRHRRADQLSVAGQGHQHFDVQHARDSVVRSRTYSDSRHLRGSLGTRPTAARPHQGTSSMTLRQRPEDTHRHRSVLHRQSTGAWRGWFWTASPLAIARPASNAAR